jgi:hypothetical protein
MAELPKIVKSRLAQAKAPDHAAHLDANLLAAFAEQTLLDRERTAVSAHLAQCADCREALALATVVPAAQLTAVAPKRRWFLEWRWVGAAAAACCVMAVALQYGVQPPAVRYTVAPPAGAPPAPLPAQPAQQIAAATKLKVELKKALQLPPAPLPSQEQIPPTVMTLDVKPPEENPVAVAITPVVPLAELEQANKLLPSGLEPKAFQGKTARGQTDVVELQAKSGLRPRATAFAQGMVAGAPVAAARAVSRVSAPAVLWSINASPATAGNARGVVERSLDAGKTWEVVPLSEDVSFRTVSAAGASVWVGGTNSALFHSSDGGVHWERITVADEAANLTGTVVNIDARDANSIKVTTSAGEEWISSDGGRKWRQR